MKTLFLFLFYLFIITSIANATAPQRQTSYTPNTTIRSSDVTDNEDEIFGYLQTGVDTIRTDGVDDITEIKSTLKSGSDQTLVTGTKGTENDLGVWDANGDIVGTSGALVWTGTNSIVTVAGTASATMMFIDSLKSCSQALETDSAGKVVCGTDQTGSGGSITFDIGDDGGNDSTALNEIATSGDTNSIFTEPSADKMLITLSNDWPKADTADDLTCTNCIGPTEINDINSSTPTTGFIFVADGNGFNSVQVTGFDPDNDAVNEVTISSAGDVTVNSLTTASSADPNILFDTATSGDTDFYIGVNEDADGVNDDIVEVRTIVTAGQGVIASFYSGGRFTTTDINSTTTAEGRILASDGSDFNSVLLSGDASITGTGDFQIGANTITAADIADINSTTATAGNIFVADGNGFNSVSSPYGYSLAINSNSFSPADGTTYYIGGLYSLTPSSGTGASRRLYIPKAGTIKTIYVFIAAGGAGTSETSTMSLRLNDTTDTTISSSITVDAVTQVFSNTSLGIAVVAGDYVEIKWVTPTWVTNPTTVPINAIIYID